MAQTDSRLKTVFIGAFLWAVVLGIVGLYLHFAAEQRQAQRETIYLKARALAAKEQRQRFNEYKKRREERILNRQYDQGRVVRPRTSPKK